MLNVLIVENGTDPRLRRALQGEAYDLTATRWDGLAERLTHSSPDLVVADLGDSSTGAQVAELRRRSVDDHIPCLLVVDAASLAALLEQPFVGDFLIDRGAEPPGDELRVRMRRMVKAHLAHKASQAIAVDGLTIDPAAHEVRLEGQLVELTYQEFLLLAFLATNRGKACTRQQLLVRVWGYNDIGGTRTVDIHIRRIREKLGAVYGGYIQTIRHVGYKFSQETLR